jgi:ribonuclease HII
MKQINGLIARSLYHQEDRAINKQQAMSFPDFTLENEFSGLVAGVDEAGRGPWAGPVVASALIANDKLPEGINDSKKLSAAKRFRLYEQILSSQKVGVGLASAEEIDKLNILNATKLAMKRALDELNSEFDAVLVDGNSRIEYPRAKNIIPVIKGDSKSLSIAAASIVAKVTRDRIMIEIAKEYPDYGFGKHMGYGTKQHTEALEKYGVTEHHRKSFKPIEKLLWQNEKSG